MNGIADQTLAEEKTQYSKIENHQNIIFQENEELTLGVEIEFQLIDKNSLDLAPRSAELLKAVSYNPKFKKEFFLSTIEVNTNICKNVMEVEQDLSKSLNYLMFLGKKIDVEYATTGCHPFAKYNNCLITPSKRYQDLVVRNQWLARRTTVYGLHVHIGMKNGEDCIRFNNFFMHLLPQLLALSSSSPFWQGYDTGLASCRPTTYEALPTASQPYSVNNWQDFQNLCTVLKKCSAIKSLKDLWWDIRPNPLFGTLEIRVCDGTATLAETLGIVAFIHVLADWFRDNGDWIDQVQLPAHWISRENKWRVIRYGLNAKIIVSNNGHITPIKDDIRQWLQKLQPYIDKYNYNKYIEILFKILDEGSSSARQRRVFHKSESLKEVVRHNIREFQAGIPDWRI